MDWDGGARCLGDRLGGLLVDEAARCLTGQGQRVFREHFRLVHRMSWSPLGQGPVHQAAPQPAIAVDLSYGGVFKDSSGVRYEGELREGVPHGQGVLTTPDGWRYEGGLREGELHGQDVITAPDGTRIEGEFRDADAHGQRPVSPEGKRCGGAGRKGGGSGTTREVP